MLPLCTLRILFLAAFLAHGMGLTHKRYQIPCKVHEEHKKNGGHDEESSSSRGMANTRTGDETGNVRA